MSTTHINSFTFRESQDGILYHLCDYPMHNHHVPEQYTVCYDIGAWTWESRYAR